MFERRLKFLLVLFGLAFVCIAARLAELQILDADEHRARAERALTTQPQTLPFVRGAIREREGRVLVADEPCWDVTIDYGVIAADATSEPGMVSSLAKKWSRKSPVLRASLDSVRARDRTGGAAESPEELRAALDAAFLSELDQMWVDLAQLQGSGLPQAAEEMRRRARSIHDRVSRVRTAVAARRGFDAPVAEEQVSHPIMAGLSSAQQIAARERLARYPWLAIEPSSQRRLATHTEPFAHILGRMGRVQAEDIENDPNGDDPFASYRSGEVVGLSGVEWAAEQRLRGRRGQVAFDREGNVVADSDVAAENGADATLTIHGELQRRLFELLAETVQSIPESPGGAIVAVDVASREVLALVSYPSFDPTQFDELYPKLVDDTDRLPLRFRAVASRYSPGSTVKPLVCLAGLSGGAITLGSREDCTGYLFEEQRDKWRCWEMHGTDVRMAHGSVDVVEALAGSCNIFMFRLGQYLGADRICDAFDWIGVGRGAGTGLREENPGINPTASWLAANKRQRHTVASARLYAIGQAEVTMTPVQVANLMAAYASGLHRSLKLVREDSPTPEWTLPGSREHWRAIRQGMYGVVNDLNGTAYKYAHFVHRRWALVGKTGSATAYPWPTSYRITYHDANGGSAVASVRGGSEQDALDRFRADHPDATVEPDGVKVATRWPRVPAPDGDEYSHAWFGGFLQEHDGAGNALWEKEPRIAFAALVEFGGSGARTSGPLARRICEILLEVLGEDLRG